MPLENLHMTVLEVNHSLTEPEIEELVTTLESKVSEITDFTLDHHARLVKPMLGYDGAATALGFLPAAGESTYGNRSGREDRYTYHHLRRDVYNLSASTGVKIASRYTVPSSHLTIGRFITKNDFAATEHGRENSSPAKMAKWIRTIEDTNRWLQDEYWPNVHGMTNEDGQWIIGQEKGLDCRMGTLWYGGGKSVRLGQGF